MQEIAANGTVDLPKLFGRTAPVQVDLGCGDGSFLLQLAELYPGKNFLGIERLARRVAKTGRKANRVENLRVLRTETAYAVESLFPPKSIEAFHLLFPDPWPKRRHHRRRIVTAPFLNAIHRALEPHGLFHIATDYADYFQQIHRLASNMIALDNAHPELDGLKPSSFRRFEIIESADANFPRTTFEKRFCAAGASIYRLSLRKISPVT